MRKSCEQHKKYSYFFLRFFRPTHTPIFSHSFHRFDPSTNRTQPSEQSCFFFPFFVLNFSHKKNIVGDVPVRGQQGCCSVPLVKHFCSYIFIVAFIFIWTSSLSLGSACRSVMGAARGNVGLDRHLLYFFYGLWIFCVDINLKQSGN